MGKTILITGASSGIGKETAKYFNKKDWNVIATMRTPENENELTELSNVLITKLDVTNESSIRSAVSDGISTFGNIDVLLNNAGYGAYGPLEAFPIENIRRQFDTNVIGLLATTKAVLPHMRKNKSGMIINISSIGGKMTFPLGTLYHGTKFAVEGLSESLHFELQPLGIKVKIIEPGMIKTDFGGRSFDFTNDESLSEYQQIVQKIFARWGSDEQANSSSPPIVVAQTIYKAITDGSDTLRYTAGEDAKEIIAARNAMSDATFIEDLKTQFKLN